MGAGRGWTHEWGSEQHPAHGWRAPAHVVVFAPGLLGGSLCLATPLPSSGSAVLVVSSHHGFLTPLPSSRSENYVIRWASTGVPQDIELLNNLKAIFTVSADPSGAALLLLPASPLLRSCLRLLPSPLPAEVPPPPRPLQHFGCIQHNAGLQPVSPSKQPNPRSSQLLSPCCSFLSCPPAHPTPQLLLRPQSCHWDVGTHHRAAPCGLPSQLQGCWGCWGARAPISAPAVARSWAQWSLAEGRRRRRQHLLSQHFSLLHQQSWADPQDCPSGAIDMQMSWENQC